jgi:hypothetical protein
MSSVIRNWVFRLPAFLLVILLFTSFAVAQNFGGGINGTVTDHGGLLLQART